MKQRMPGCLYSSFAKERGSASIRSGEIHTQKEAHDPRRDTDMEQRLTAHAHVDAARQALVSKFSDLTTTVLRRRMPAECRSHREACRFHSFHCNTLD